MDLPEHLKIRKSAMNSPSFTITKSKETPCCTVSYVMSWMGYLKPEDRRNALELRCDRCNSLWVKGVDLSGDTWWTKSPVVDMSAATEKDLEE
jgi:hypothetical protein